jgi:hypothetical protein
MDNKLQKGKSIRSKTWAMLERQNAIASFHAGSAAHLFYIYSK